MKKAGVPEIRKPPPRKHASVVEQLFSGDIDEYRLHWNRLILTSGLEIAAISKLKNGTAYLFRNYGRTLIRRTSD